MIGRARHRAVLEAKVLTPDGGGGYSESWGIYATVWAFLDILPARETVEAGRMEQRAQARLVLRRRPDVSAHHRVRIGTRVLAIRAVLDDGPQAAWMTLLCEEGAPS